MDFWRTGASTAEALKLIAQTPLGRKTLESFLPLYESRRVTFEPYPPGLIAKLRSILEPGQPIGAAFINDGTSGKIHYDPESTLGTLAPFIFHEIIHALDSKLWTDAHQIPRGSGRDSIMLQSESLAFKQQHLFIQELTQRFPEYLEFLEAHQKRTRILIDRMTDNEIADLYHLNPTNNMKRSAS